MVRCALEPCIIISEVSPVALQACSAVAPEKYLELFADLGYRISGVGEAAELPCGTNVAAALDKAHRSGTNSSYRYRAGTLDPPRTLTGARSKRRPAPCQRFDWRPPGPRGTA